MIKKRIEKALIFLKETLIVESEDARDMLKVYYDYTKGNASEEEVESANKQLNKLLKNLSFGLLNNFKSANNPIIKINMKNNE